MNLLRALRLSLLFCLELMLLSLVASACSSTPSSHSETWSVASDLDNPPFAWVDAQGAIRGRDVEMAEALAEEMGVELVWMRMEFALLLDKLEAGECDAVIATLGATAERGQRVQLSDPYYSTSLRVLVRQGTGEPLRLSELDGRVVGAGLGTTSEFAVREHLPRALLAEPSEKGSSSVERLLSGEVDALVMDGPDALDFAKEHRGKLVVLHAPLAEENYVVAVRPGAQDLLERVNSALASLRERETLSALDQKFDLESGTPDE